MSIESHAPSFETNMPGPQTSMRQIGMPRPRRVLVVDDEHLAAASLKQALRWLGYEPLGPARDGAHAIQVAFYTQPDLVLMDIRMATDRDGIDAAAALYAQMAIPVMIVSAFSGSEQTRAAGEAGVFGFVVKPATADQLRAAIDVAWARYQEALRSEANTATLHRRLEERHAIERAKWQIVEQQSLTEGQAMDLLRGQSQSEHRNLIDVAREVLGE